MLPVTTTMMMMMMCKNSTASRDPAQTSALMTITICYPDGGNKLYPRIRMWQPVPTSLVTSECK